MEKARDMYVESVRNWVEGEKPVVESESHFLDENDPPSPGLKIEEYHFFEKWLEKHFSRFFSTKLHAHILGSMSSKTIHISLTIGQLQKHRTRQRLG